MNPINNNFSTSRYHNYSGRMAYQQRRESEMVNKNTYSSMFGKTDETSNNKSNAALSKKAQSVLDALTARYGDADFYVQDFSSTAEAKEIMSGGTREFSVLLSPDELEKMANDKGYMNEKLDSIDKAMQMSDQINSQFGYTSNDKNALLKSDITRMGVSFDSNGTMTLFADLERAAKNTADNMKESMKQRPYQNRSSAKNSSSKQKYTVTASSTEELLAKLKNFSWENVPVTEEEESGFNWNFDA